MKWFLGCFKLSLIPSRGENEPHPSPSRVNINILYSFSGPLQSYGLYLLIEKKPSSGKKGVRGVRIVYIEMEIETSISY